EAETAGAEPGPFTYTFSTSKGKFIVRSNGIGKRLTQHPAAFRLKVDWGGYINNLYYLEDDSALYIIYEMTDEESGWGRIIKLDGKTLRPIWSHFIPVFNICGCLGEDHYAYITGLGLIAKIDLASGRYIWRHEGL